MFNRTAYFVSTGHVQDHFNRQTIDTKCSSTVQVHRAHVPAVTLWTLSQLLRHALHRVIA